MQFAYFHLMPWPHLPDDFEVLLQRRRAHCARLRGACTNLGAHRSRHGKRWQDWN